jgi:predicted restriction endonuclease
MKKYNWKSVQRYYNKGNSLRDCIKKFGMAKRTLETAKARGDLTTRSGATPVEDQLIIGYKISRSYLKKKILLKGLLDYHCQFCGIDSWQDQPLSLHLDHVNGNRFDNRLENLRFLCPNCHSQTPTFAGKNRKNIKKKK